MSLYTVRGLRFYPLDWHKAEVEVSNYYDYDITIKWGGEDYWTYWHVEDIEFEGGDPEFIKKIKKEKLVKEIIE